jgi:hypothetical protein
MIDLLSLVLFLLMIIAGGRGFSYWWGGLIALFACYVAFKAIVFFLSKKSANKGAG